MGEVSRWLEIAQQSERAAESAWIAYREEVAKLEAEAARLGIERLRWSAMGESECESDVDFERRVIAARGK